MKSKVIIMAFCGALALAACGHKGGNAQAGGSNSSSSTSGSAVMAKSNLDSTNDSAKMPAHVDTVKK